MRCRFIAMDGPLLRIRRTRARQTGRVGRRAACAEDRFALRPLPGEEERWVAEAAKRGDHGSWDARLRTCGGLGSNFSNGAGKAAVFDGSALKVRSTDAV
jgi:hypothetical protein